jgi:hypothetical protein
MSGRTTGNSCSNQAINLLLRLQDIRIRERTQAERCQGNVKLIPFQHELQGIVEAIKEVLRATPPELSADVMQKGMMLSKGTAQLRNLERLFAEATGVPAFVADHPQLCVAKGTGIALENLEAYKRSIFSS